MGKDVEWVKLQTDMFDNKKIKYIRTLPEGNNIVLIWVMLLTMAGRCNSGGLVFLTENIPYTTKILADELKFEESIVVMAIGVLEQLEMITTDGNRLLISGWEEYQNVDGLEKIREQTRLRNIEYRKRKRELLEGDVSVTSRVTQSSISISNSNSLSDSSSLSTSSNSKTNKFIKPTIEDIKEYCISRNNNVDAERFIDYYESNGWKVGKNPMKDWKAAVRTWERSNYGSTGKKSGGGSISLEDIL